MSEERFVDSGLSAYHGQNQRGDLAKLVNTVRSGDVILLEDVDRLTRQDWFSAMSFLAGVLAKGVKVITLRNGCEITEEAFRHNPSVFLPVMLGAHLGHDESAKKAVRVKAAWAARKLAVVAEGKPMNRNLPSWLRWNRETQQVELIEERAAIVRRIFNDYLELGSLSKVTRKLVADGVPCIANRKHSAWANSYVHQILTNRTVLGQYIHSDPPTPNIYPVLVAEKTFYRVQERLKAGRHFTARERKVGKNLFTGIARCSRCGSAMNMNSFVRPKPSKSHSYLVCGAALHDRLDCNRHGIRYELVEYSVLGLLAQERDVLAALTGVKAEPDKVEILRAKLAANQKRQGKILRLIEGEENPPKSLLRSLQALETEEGGIQAEMDVEVAKAKAQIPPEQVYAEVRDQAAELVISDRPRLQELLRGLLDRIVVDTDKREMVVYFRGGRKPMGIRVWATA